MTWQIFDPTVGPSWSRCRSGRCSARRRFAAFGYVVVADYRARRRPVEETPEAKRT